MYPGSTVPVTNPVLISEGALQETRRVWAFHLACLRVTASRDPSVDYTAVIGCPARALSPVALHAARRELDPMTWSVFVKRACQSWLAKSPSFFVNNCGSQVPTLARAAFGNCFIASLFHLGLQ